MRSALCDYRLLLSSPADFCTAVGERFLWCRCQKHWKGMHNVLCAYLPLDAQAGRKNTSHTHTHTHERGKHWEWMKCTRCNTYAKATLRHLREIHGCYTCEQQMTTCYVTRECVLRPVHLITHHNITDNGHTQPIMVWKFRTSPQLPSDLQFSTPQNQIET